MRRMVMRLCVAGLCWTTPAWGGVDYGDPGWSYVFEGDAADPGVSQGAQFDALDGTWQYANGSSSWDGTPIGTVKPGGISALLEGETTFVRIQDTGNPANHGFGGDPSNRKMWFGHDTEAAADLLDTGVTLSFRARITTGDPLDDLHPDGGGAITPWPAGGLGYAVRDSGKGMFCLRQATEGIVSFTLVTAADIGGASGGLTMSGLNGGAVTGDVDWGEGTNNLLPIADVTVWHEFWITIEADTTGGGSHRVDVYVDGALTATSFHVTNGSGHEDEMDGMTYLAMGSPGTGVSAAFDSDFFAFAPGVLAPIPVKECDLTVSPGAKGVTMDLGGPDPADVAFTVQNVGLLGEPISYSLRILDQDRNEAVVPWLSVDTTAGGPLGEGETDTITASFDGSGLVSGVHVAYLEITDTCQPEAGVDLIRIAVGITPPDTRIPQRMIADGSGYMELMFSPSGQMLSWDEARVQINTNPPGSFGGAPGGVPKLDSLTLSVPLGSRGDVWVMATDSTATSTLDGFDLATLGTVEGTFMWLDGTPVAPPDTPGSLWPPGAGTTSDAEHALEIKGNGLWNDNEAGESLNSCCQDNPFVVFYPVDLSGQGRFEVLERKSAGPLNDLQAGLALLRLAAGDPNILKEVEANYHAVSFGDPGSPDDGDGAGTREGWDDWPKVAFPTDTPLENDEDFAGRARGTVILPQSGMYTLAVVHDDWVRFMVDNGGDKQVVDSADSVGVETIVFTVGGESGSEADGPFEVVADISYVEREGDAYVQLFGAEGDQRDLLFRHVFRLVGDELGGGFAVKTPPDVCGKVWADIDRDDDVDTRDFGILQLCLSPQGGPVAEGCECFDRDGGYGDRDVDIDDVAAFVDCTTGAEVPWNQELTPDCVPLRP